MHSLLHTEIARATDRPTLPPRRAIGSPPSPDPPPRRMRGFAAARLAALASRLDRETARRAVA